MQNRFAIMTALALLGIPAGNIQGQARFGVISGLSRATFTGGGAQGITWRTTLMVGGMADIGLGEAFAVRSELHFATKGPRARVGETADAALKLSYLQLPVLVQLLTEPGILLSPRLYAGVSLGVLLRCRRKDLTCSDDPGLDIRSFDYALLVGGEIEVFGAGLGVRYEAGLGSVTARAPGLEIQNGVLSFTVRYLFQAR